MSNQIQTEVFTWKLLLKNKTTLNITQAQYEEIVQCWANKEHRNIYLGRQERWLDTFDIKEPINLEVEKRKREAKYTKLPDTEDETEEERSARMGQIIKTKALVKYMFKGIEAMAKQEKQDAKEYYLNLGRETKERLSKLCTDKEKKELEEELANCRKHYKILDK